MRVIWVTVRARAHKIHGNIKVGLWGRFTGYRNLGDHKRVSLQLDSVKGVDKPEVKFRVNTTHQLEHVRGKYV